MISPVDHDFPLVPTNFRSQPLSRSRTVPFKSIMAFITARVTGRMSKGQKGGSFRLYSEGGIGSILRLA